MSGWDAHCHPRGMPEGSRGLRSAPGATIPPVHRAAEPHPGRVPEPLANGLRLADLWDAGRRGHTPGVSLARHPPRRRTTRSRPWPTWARTLASRCWENPLWPPCCPASQRAPSMARRFLRYWERCECAGLTPLAAWTASGISRHLPNPEKLPASPASNSSGCSHCRR